MNYYDAILKESLGKNYKDIPLNECPRSAGMIRISFSFSKKVTLYDEDVQDAIKALTHALGMFAHEMGQRWDVYHPLLSMLLEEGTIQAKALCKEKEERESERD